MRVWFDAKAQRRRESCFAQCDGASYAVPHSTTVVNIFTERLLPITPPGPPASGGEQCVVSPPLAGGLGGDCKVSANHVLDKVRKYFTVQVRIWHPDALDLKPETWYLKPYLKGD